MLNLNTLPKRKKLLAFSFFLILLGYIFYYGAHRPGNNLFGQTVWSLSTKEKVIALTFDDGPNPIYTKQILDILRNHDVKATFFLLGENAERYPDIAKSVVQAGHVIGNHTFGHATLGLRLPSEIETEIKQAEEIILNVTGVKPVFFRPPRGHRNPFLFQVTKKMGYVVVGWSVDPKDWSRPTAEKITKRILTKIKPGAIILFHDGSEKPEDKGFDDRSQTVATLPIILEELKSQGYRLVTIKELLEM